MGRKSSLRVIRAQVREHARMAKLLLPPTPENCPPYTRQYFESYRAKLFEACRHSRHRHCPQTAEWGTNHVYCKCPCHRKDVSKHKRRQLWLQYKAELAQEERKGRKVRDPNTPRPVAGTKARQKVFRYLHPPKDKIPAGIMHLVHAAIAELQQGTVAEVAALAVKNGLAGVTGQDPINQTSVMLHRMLKAGVVEIV